MSLGSRRALLVLVTVFTVGSGCPARRSKDPDLAPEPRTTNQPILPVIPVQETSRVGIVAAPPGFEHDAGDEATEPLQVEERERDPRSEMVTIKVSVDRPKCAHVFWGSKDLGEAPLEIRRPRGSGPMDLLVRCAGMLTVHTRVFTDRDDRIAIHLFRESEATSVFGYRPPGR